VTDGLAAASARSDSPVGTPAPSGPGGIHRLGLRGGVVEVGRAVLQVLPAWVAARVVVIVALAVAREGVGTLRPGNPEAFRRIHEGLLSWDAGWYQAIAQHGYAGAGQQSVRFFPLFPLLGRALGAVPGTGDGAALVMVANLSALVAMAGLWLLVRHDSGDVPLARRSVWLLALAPSAYSLVLAYSDATLLLCSVVAFLGARTGRWWWAAAAGLAAGADRPVGVLLVVPVAVEVWSRSGEPAGPATWAARLVALAAPLAGAGAYLAWVGHRFGDPWLPFTVQEQNGHRGAFAAPVSAMWHDVVDAVHGHHLGSALHVPWVAVCIALVVVCWRRLPGSYTAFAVAVLAVSLSSTNLDSFERYALGAFPLVVAASTHTTSRRVERVVLVASGLAMAGYATMSFLGVVVP
jgi:hypothetical protein